MNENRFAAAGWASIAAAVLLPTAFIVAGMEGAALEMGVVDYAAGIGIGDFLLLVLGAVLIYVLLSLKRLMYDRYSFRGLDLIIWLAILWTIVNYGGSFVLEMVLSMVSRSPLEGPMLVTTTFWIICVAVFGIIDIVMGIILIQQRHRFNTPLRIFAILTLVTGVCEALVMLSFLALLVYPAALIALAFAFLKQDEVVEII